MFRDELVALGAERDDIVAITAAMLHPTGLDGFAAAYPERTFDVGIAEQHAVTSAAGMAMAGLHPVVAIYATFLNRAFDQVLMDAALHRCGITLVLDRAGVTGEDGRRTTACGTCRSCRSCRGCAWPHRATARLRELLREAVAVTTRRPSSACPKGAVPADIEAVESITRRRRPGAPTGDQDVLVVAVGAMAGVCVEVAERLGAQGIGVTVVDPRWVKPVNPALVELAARTAWSCRSRTTVRVGGCGAVLAQVLRDAACRRAGRGLRHPAGVPGARQARGDLLEQVGLNAQQLAREITAQVAAMNRPTLRRRARPLRLAANRGRVNSKSGGVRVNGGLRSQACDRPTGRQPWACCARRASSSR